MHWCCSEGWLRASASPQKCLYKLIKRIALAYGLQRMRQGLPSSHRLDCFVQKLPHFASYCRRLGTSLLWGKTPGTACVRDLASGKLP